MIVDSLMTLVEKEGFCWRSRFGACDQAEIGYYDVEQQKYYGTTNGADGDGKSGGGECFHHGRKTLSASSCRFRKADGTLMGGHLQGVISGTGEALLRCYQEDRQTCGYKNRFECLTL